MNSGSDKKVNFTGAPYSVFSFFLEPLWADLSIFCWISHKKVILAGFCAKKNFELYWILWILMAFLEPLIQVQGTPIEVSQTWLQPCLTTGPTANARKKGAMRPDNFILVF